MKKFLIILFACAAFLFGAWTPTTFASNVCYPSGNAGKFVCEPAPNSPDCESIDLNTASCSSIPAGYTAAADNGNGTASVPKECIQTSKAGEYVCTPSPQSCTAIPTPPNSSVCSSFPSGYTDKTPPSVVVTVTPSSGTVGSVAPTVSWVAYSNHSYPTTCSGEGISSNNGPTSGSVTLGIISSVGTKTYTITCTNALGTASDKKSVTVTAPKTAAQPTQSVIDPCTNAGGGKLGYCPLEPLPGFQSGATIEFVPFLRTIFKLLIIAGALLAVATLVYAGISYILSEAFETKGEARKRMVAAFYGLAILLGAWLMLYTINPTLLNFDLSSIGSAGGSATNGTNDATQQTAGQSYSAEDARNCTSNYHQLPSGNYVCQ